MDKKDFGIIGGFVLFLLIITGVLIYTVKSWQYPLQITAICASFFGIIYSAYLTNKNTTRQIKNNLKISGNSEKYKILIEKINACFIKGRDLLVDRDKINSLMIDIKKDPDIEVNKMSFDDYEKKVVYEAVNHFKNKLEDPILYLQLFLPDSVNFKAVLKEFNSDCSKVETRFGKINDFSNRLANYKSNLVRQGMENIDSADQIQETRTYNHHKNEQKFHDIQLIWDKEIFKCFTDISDIYWKWSKKYTKLSYKILEN